jgi:hypothetical protein
MALALRLLSAVALLSLAFGEVEHCCLISPLLSAHAFANADIGFTWCTPRQADDDNTHAILQRLADASQSLMPVGDITVAEYNELRHGQETMSKEVAFIYASGPRCLSTHLALPTTPLVRTASSTSELRPALDLQLDALEAAVRKKKMQVKVHVLPAAPGVKVRHGRTVLSFGRRRLTDVAV